MTSAVGWANPIVPRVCCVLCYLPPTTPGETAINHQRDEMTYVFAMTRIQLGGVEASRYRVLLYHVFVFVYSHGSPRPHPLLPQKDLDAKAAFVMRSPPCMTCMPLPRRKCSDDDPAFLCHVSCAACLVFIIRSLFARVHDTTSAKRRLDSTSLQPFEQAIESGHV